MGNKAQINPDSHFRLFETVPRDNDGLGGPRIHGNPPFGTEIPPPPRIQDLAGDPGSSGYKGGSYFPFWLYLLEEKTATEHAAMV